MEIIKKIIIILFSTFFIYSCSTNPYNVSKDDTQVVLNTDTGKIIDVVPVKIKGDPSEIAATIGGLIGGISWTRCWQWKGTRNCCYCRFNNWWCCGILFNCKTW